MHSSVCPPPETSSLLPRPSGHGRGRYGWALTLALLLGATTETGARAQPQGGAVAPMALSLEEAVALVRNQNFRIERARRSVESSRLRERDVDAQLLPRLDLGLNVNDAMRTSRFQQQGQTRVESPENVLSGNLTGTAYLQLDISGTVARQRKQAELSSASMVMNYHQVLLDLESEVRSAYFEALRAQEHLAADEQALQRLEELIRRVPGRREDLRSFLEVERASSLQNLGASRNNLDLALSGLAQQLRLPGSTPLRLSTRMSADIPVVDPERVLTEGPNNRTDIKDAKLRVEQAELSLSQVRDYRKPSASIFAYTGYSQSAYHRNPVYDSSGSYTAIMFNLNIPLLQWDGGVLDNSERIAMMGLAQAHDDLLELQERARVESRQMLFSLQQARQRLRSLPHPELALAALASAEKGLLESEQWEAAVAQVSNARQLWRLALSAHIDALSDYYAVYFRLQRSMGGALP